MSKYYRLLLSAILGLFSLSMLATSAYAGGSGDTTAAHRVSNKNFHTKTMVIPRISAINALGPIRITLLPAKSTQKTIITIKTRRAHPLLTKVKGHTLYLAAQNAMTPKNKRPQVTIKTDQLRSLKILGSASVTAKGLRSQGLSLYADTSGTIHLTGMMNLKQIYNFGPGHIFLRWIKSPKLTIYSVGGGTIYIAGVVNTLKARILGHANLNAEYLRTQHASVQTKGFAQARVFPINSLRAFAMGNSNIYYYKKPKYLTEFTHQSGNVLQMAWRH